MRVDDPVMETKEAWPAKLRRNRNIGDFRSWMDHDAYQRARSNGCCVTCRSNPRRNVG